MCDSTTGTATTATATNASAEVVVKKTAKAPDALVAAQWDIWPSNEQWPNNRPTERRPDAHEKRQPLSFHPPYRTDRTGHTDSQSASRVAVARRYIRPYRLQRQLAGLPKFRATFGGFAPRNFRCVSDGRFRAREPPAAFSLRENSVASAS